MFWIEIDTFNPEAPGYSAGKVRIQRVRRRQVEAF
jgi:hypothetical protein